MNSIDEQTALRAAVAHYGVESQVNQMVEECAEFIVCVNHCRRSRKTATELIEEMADMEIVLEQLKMVYGGEEWESARLRKIERLKNRIAEDMAK